MQPALPLDEEPAYFTDIRYIGSRDASGQYPPLEMLEEVLRLWEIDPYWRETWKRRPFLGDLREVDGERVWVTTGPVFEDATIVRFAGNFARISFGFHIDTNDADIIARLTRAQAHQPKLEPPTFNPYAPVGAATAAAKGMQ